MLPKKLSILKFLGVLESILSKLYKFQSIVILTFQSYRWQKLYLQSFQGPPLIYGDVLGSLRPNYIATSILVKLSIVWKLSIHSFIQEDRPGEILCHVQ